MIASPLRPVARPDHPDADRAVVLAGDVPLERRDFARAVGRRAQSRLSMGRARGPGRRSTIEAPRPAARGRMPKSGGRARWRCTIRPARLIGRDRDRRVVEEADEAHFRRALPLVHVEPGRAVEDEGARGPGRAVLAEGTR